jgi:hypothetical protein
MLPPEGRSHPSRVFIERTSKDDAMKKWNQVTIAVAAIFATLTPASAQAPQTYLQKSRTFQSAEAFAKETGGKLTVERRLRRGTSGRGSWNDYRLGGD